MQDVGLHEGTHTTGYTHYGIGHTTILNLRPDHITHCDMLAIFTQKPEEPLLIPFPLY
jgi:hypothetical protein